MPVGGSVGLVASLFLVAIFPQVPPSSIGPAVLVGFLVALIMGLATIPRLEKTDPLYIRVARIAARKGVRVGRVSVYPSDTGDISVSLFGNISISQSLLDRLNEREVDAMVAHEIGHFHYRHARRTGLICMGAVIAYSGAEWLRETFVKHPGLREVGHGLNVLFVFSPLLMIFLSYSGKSRKVVCKADAFAVECIGDPEVLISALTKIHDANLTPHQLRLEDEKVHTHPSLESRIAAIRKIGRPSHRPN